MIFFNGLHSIKFATDFWEGLCCLFLSRDHPRDFDAANKSE